MTGQPEIVREIERAGYAVLPQELLGFNQPTPYLGFIDGKHPRDWLMSN